MSSPDESSSAGTPERCSPGSEAGPAEGAEEAGWSWRPDCLLSGLPRPRCTPSSGCAAGGAGGDEAEAGPRWDEAYLDSHSWAGACRWSDGAGSGLEASEPGSPGLSGG